jgi:hypothetical protein
VEQLFNQRQFDMAIICFERAGDEKYAILAKAAQLQQTGERQITVNPSMALTSLREAAKLFLSVGRPEASAKCLIKGGEFKNAGKVVSLHASITF